MFSHILEHSLSIIIFRILYIVLKRSRLRNRINNIREAQNGNMFAIWIYDGKMVHESIIEAAKEFDSKYCVGVGGCGSLTKQSYNQVKLLL